MRNGNYTRHLWCIFAIIWLNFFFLADQRWFFLADLRRSFAILSTLIHKKLFYIIFYLRHQIFSLSNSPLKIRGVPPKAEGVMIYWELKRSGEVRNGNYQLQITNYEFQFLLSLFDWCGSNTAEKVLPFRQGEVAVSLSAGRRPTVMKVIAFQAKGKKVKIEVGEWMLENQNYKSYGLSALKAA